MSRLRFIRPTAFSRVIFWKAHIRSPAQRKSCPGFSGYIMVHYGDGTDWANTARLRDISVSGGGFTACHHGSFQLGNALRAANRIGILIQRIGNKANRAKIASLAFRGTQHNADNVNGPAIWRIEINGLVKAGDKDCCLLQLINSCVRQGDAVANRRSAQLFTGYQG